MNERYKYKLYKALPHRLQNTLIVIYNMRAYKIRHGGSYWKFRNKIKANTQISLTKLKAHQRHRYRKLIVFATSHSTYYRNILRKSYDVTDIYNIHKLPIISKEDLREHIDEIVVKDTPSKLIPSKTGGTTGKSLTVYNFPRDIQERAAFLDNFRSQFGYELGKKTAWFSGKSLLTQRDIKKLRFWKTDFIHKVRYYSTFHIKDEYLKYYIGNLIEYKPEFLIGFPSTMNEIAKYGLLHNIEYPAGTVNAIFPTAETLTPVIRKNIERFFKARIYDQYASSEGAPFILECKNGNLHLELQTGVFEVLDDDNNRAKSGRLVVTSFTNEGTPLIRYDIKDSISLEDEDKVCGCGNHNPLVKKIIGRIDDYVWSPENGKINLGNISNTLKGTKGIIRFQVIQNHINSVTINIVVDKSVYTESIKKIFLNNWRDRIGQSMDLNLKIVEEIPVENSGKYRIVKNNIKHLLD